MKSKVTRRAVLAGLSATLILPARNAAASNTRLGLIFVAQSTCPYCRSLAPVLSQVGDTGQADVMLASMDRRPLPPFVRFEDGITHPLTQGFKTVPQVLVYNGRLDQITHVVGGVRTMRRFVLRLSMAMRQSAAM